MHSYWCIFYDLSISRRHYLEFYFGAEGIFPLQDLSKSHQKALSNALSRIEMGKLIPFSGNGDKEALAEAGDKMVQLLGLKYALDVALGERSINEGKDEISKVKSSNPENVSDLLSSKECDELTKRCINFLANPAQKNFKPEEASAIFSEIEAVFDKLTAPKQMPTEKALNEIFTQKKVKDIEGLASRLMYGNLQIKKVAISGFIRDCINNNLDPTPVLQLYPKTTFVTFNEMVGKLAKPQAEPKTQDKPKSKDELESFFGKIGILIAIGDVVVKILPQNVDSNFLNVFRFSSHIEKLRQYKTRYANASDEKEKQTCYEEAHDFLEKNGYSLQYAIKGGEEQCEYAGRLV